VRFLLGLFGREGHGHHAFGTVWCLSPASIGAHSMACLSDQEDDSARVEELFDELYEEESSETVQSQLSSEMRELKERVQEQGQDIIALTQRLEDERNTFTSELGVASTKQAELEAELAAARAQQKQLVDIFDAEEGEARGRICLVEHELASVSSSSASLVGQISAAREFEEELMRSISVERRGRSELVLAGEQEQELWSERQDQIHCGVEGVLESQREVELWKAHSHTEAARLQERASEHSSEERHLVEEIRSVRETQVHLRVGLESEAQSWQRETLEFEALVETLDAYNQEEARAYQDLSAEHSCAEEESSTVKEHMEIISSNTHNFQAGLATLEPQLRDLEQLREEMLQRRAGRVSQLVSQERELREELVQALQESKEWSAQRAHLEAQLRTKSRLGFNCFRRRTAISDPLRGSHGLQPLAPPSEPPPGRVTGQ